MVDSLELAFGEETLINRFCNHPAHRRHSLKMFQTAENNGGTREICRPLFVFVPIFREAVLFSKIRTQNYYRPQTAMPNLPYK
jgi:hypothetical protein